MNKIEYGTEFLDQLKDSVHDLYDENKELKKEIERIKIDYQQANDIIVEQNKEIEELKKYKYRPSSKINFDKLMNSRKEIARLKENYVILQNASDEVEEEQAKEIERLNNIIKEVREEMENAKHISVNDEYHIIEHEKKLLEILDKGVDKE